MRDPHGHEWMTTYTGRRVYPLDMRTEDIVIEDGMTLQTVPTDRLERELVPSCPRCGEDRQVTVWRWGRLLQCYCDTCGWTWWVRVEDKPEAERGV